MNLRNIFLVTLLFTPLLTKAMARQESMASESNSQQQSLEADETHLKDGADFCKSFSACTTNEDAQAALEDFNAYLQTQPQKDTVVLQFCCEIYAEFEKGYNEIAEAKGALPQMPDGQLSIMTGMAERIADILFSFRDPAAFKIELFVSLHNFCKDYLSRELAYEIFDYTERQFLTYFGGKATKHDASVAFIWCFFDYFKDSEDTFKRFVKIALKNFSYSWHVSEEFTAAFQRLLKFRVPDSVDKYMGLVFDVLDEKDQEDLDASGINDLLHYQNHNPFELLAALRNAEEQDQNSGRHYRRDT